VRERAGQRPSCQQPRRYRDPSPIKNLDSRLPSAKVLEQLGIRHVCGMNVDGARAVTKEITGERFYFCSQQWRVQQLRTACQRWVTGAKESFFSREG
jgi:hypothetical protein